MGVKKEKACDSCNETFKVKEIKEFRILLIYFLKFVASRSWNLFEESNLMKLRMLNFSNQSCSDKNCKFCHFINQKYPIHCVSKHSASFIPSQMQISTKISSNEQNNNLFIKLRHRCYITKFQTVFSNEKRFNNVCYYQRESPTSKKVWLPNNRYVITCETLCQRQNASREFGLEIISRLHIDIFFCF